MALVSCGRSLVVMREERLRLKYWVRVGDFGGCGWRECEWCEYEEESTDRECEEDVEEEEILWSGSGDEVSMLLLVVGLVRDVIVLYC